MLMDHPSPMAYDSDKVPLKQNSPTALKPSGSHRSITRKSIKDVSFQATKLSQSQSIMTDNSERLRENLEMLKKSKLISELKKKTKE